MTLASSGTMSIGGSTATRSINLELGLSATATSNMNSAALRGLAGVSSGAIAMSNFYGKSSSLDTQTVTVGYYPGNAYVGPQWGFNSITGYGSCSDGSCNFYSGAAYHYLYYFDLNASNGYFTFGVAGNVSNSGWTTCTANGTAYQRTAALSYSYNSSSNTTFWQWNDGGAGPNPMGTTTGATKTVVFT
tara:strand:- start:11 stop:577 length:567 start_codon:yes stop_codon:yes gene_type:complete